MEGGGKNMAPCLWPSWLPCCPLKQRPHSWPAEPESRPLSNCMAWGKLLNLLVPLFLHQQNEADDTLLL